MKNACDHIGVGLGVIIQNQGGNILIGKRKGIHAPFYSIPGGTIEPGETFEQAAIREVKEETGLTLQHPHVIAMTNNNKTFTQEGVHTISVILFADTYDGELQVAEPEKCAGWQWIDPRNLPTPHYEGSEIGVRCFLKQIFYDQAR